MGGKLSCSVCHIPVPKRLKIINRLAPKLQKYVTDDEWVRQGKHEYICLDCWLKEHCLTSTTEKQKKRLEEFINNEREIRGHKDGGRHGSKETFGMDNQTAKRQNHLKHSEEVEDKDNETETADDFEYIERGDDKWLKYNEIEIPLQGENKTEARRLRKKAKKEYKREMEEAELDRWRHFHTAMETRFFEAAVERENRKIQAGYLCSSKNMSEHSGGQGGKKQHVRQQKRQKRRRHSRGNRRR